MGRMGRQDQGGFSSTAHPTNQKGHRLSSTCVKSRAQVITGEQQMLHLRDGSRTVPDEQEFASEPQRKALPTAAVGSGDQNAASTTQHQVLPPHTFSTDHPHHYRTLMPGTSGSPPRPLRPSKRGAAISKATRQVLEAVASPTSPPDHSQEAEISPEENSSSRNRPPRSSFKWLSDPFKQI